ncbi:putative LEAF RUST 10 DISEASE-RESISTANCE LOCUS RECEPTOR-LIKE PROTEIN KINASE-like 1.1/1.2/1.3/1.4 [Helianthus debilis subsp. tardiflorus]
MKVISLVAPYSLLLEFEMILVFFFGSVFLSCVPVLHSTTDISKNNCPENFTCPALPSFKYPFYNVTETRCGLIKVNCTSKGGEIQLGGVWYEIAGKDEGHNIVIISNKTFADLVSNNSCEAFMNNFTSPSPSPLLYSISIFPIITLFKCTENLTNAQQRDTYFKQHSYKSHYGCKDYEFYYNHLNGTVPSDLPHTCQVVHLPLKVPDPGFDETNIFSLLSSGVQFELTPSCRNCHTDGDQCRIENEHFQCLNAKKETQGRKLIKILGISLSLYSHLNNSKMISIKKQTIYTKPHNKGKQRWIYKWWIYKWLLMSAQMNTAAADFRVCRLR